MAQPDQNQAETHQASVRRAARSRAKVPSEPMVAAPAPSGGIPDHVVFETHDAAVRRASRSRANGVAKPTPGSPAPDHASIEAQAPGGQRVSLNPEPTTDAPARSRAKLSPEPMSAAPVPPGLPDQASGETQGVPVRRAARSRAIPAAEPIPYSPTPDDSSDQSMIEAHPARVQSARSRAKVPSEPKPAAPAPAVEVQKLDATQPPRDFTGLRLAAEMLDEFERLRKTCANRFERGGADQDEGVSGYRRLMASTEATERLYIKVLEDEYRRVVPEPIRRWQEETPQLGTKTFARLLGHLGHPVHAQPYHWQTEEIPPEHECGATCGKGRHLVADPPYDRLVSQLWQYCGVGNPKLKRKKGEDGTAAGKPRLRPILFVISEGCMKNPGPFRRVYEEARERYAERLHDEPCVRCGPRGHPAQADTPWSKAHQHAAALRLVAKEILFDLWKVAGGASPLAKPIRAAPRLAIVQEGESCPPE